MPDTQFPEEITQSSISAAETEFSTLAEKALSRRRLLGTGAALGMSAFLLGTSALVPTFARAAGKLSFKQVAANSLDTVTVPEGYSWHIVMKWGDPLWSKGQTFDNASRGSGDSQELAAGDNFDGMWLFPAPGGRNVLAVNNEYTNTELIHGNRASKKAENLDDVRKSKAGHGVTIVEIATQGDKWATVKDSTYNRRITADTLMDFTGPAKGHDWLKTSADPSGSKVMGTINNCGSGRTPWGTFLTCEENFNGNFGSVDANYKPSDAFVRYGISAKDSGYLWYAHDPRFDVAKNPNEPNRHGYVVEIDPLNPNSTPKKLSALGRFKHENAEVVISGNGQVVVYSGDDERSEFLYKFVSEGRYIPGAASNANLLETGKLYVAKFSDDGKGQWIELTPATTGMASQAEICIHTRQAASRAGATTMDRPEWVAVHPTKAEAYCCLTNNINRGVKPNAGGDPTPVGGPNPRKENSYGQIVRWVPENNDHTATAFTWNLYAVAGNPNVATDEYAGSKNINKENTFNSPDGLTFDTTGMLWIQTDGNYSNDKIYAGQGNNQMLVGDPESGEIRRFLVGPRQCEVTGITWSFDRKTIFVAMQHPGEDGGDSHFPDGGTTVARSAVIAITKDEGTPIV